MRNKQRFGPLFDELGRETMEVVVWIGGEKLIDPEILHLPGRLGELSDSGFVASDFRAVEGASGRRGGGEDHLVPWALLGC